MAALENSQRKALLDLILKTGYRIVQENGQRLFGPPLDWEGPPPPKGSEIFIGKIPRDCFEDELVPVFSQVGKIYQLRVMLDLSQCNRGYAFLRFSSPEEAEEAIKKLNNYEIRTNCRIGVVKSVDNQKLQITGIPENVTKEDVLLELSKFVQDVIQVVLPKCFGHFSRNQGYAIIEFASHRAAALARKKLLSSHLKPWNQMDAFQVDWARPTDFDEPITSLYLGCLKHDLDWDEFYRFVSIQGVVKVKGIRLHNGYGFVDYDCRQDAEIAFKALQVISIWCQQCTTGHQLGEVTKVETTNDYFVCSFEITAEQFDGGNFTSTAATIRKTRGPSSLCHINGATTATNDTLNCEDPFTRL